VPTAQPTQVAAVVARRAADAVPVGHAAQLAAAAYVPAGHSTAHELDPAALCRPALHGEQLADREAPVAARYVPAAHLVHTAACPVAEKVPQGQPRHDVAPADENDPGWQFWHEIAPTAAAYLPAAQPVQAKAAAGEYLPTAHAEHPIEPVTTAYWPATQLVHCALPAAAANEPTGHARQLVELVAPFVATYVPATHAAQLVVVTAKKPGPHGGAPCARIPGIDNNHTTPATNIMLRKSCSVPGGAGRGNLLCWCVQTVQLVVR
jgi:hypothetical protein